MELVRAAAATIAQQVEWLEKLQMRTDHGEPLGTRGRKLDRGLVEVARDLALLYSPRPSVAAGPQKPSPLPRSEPGQHGEPARPMSVEFPERYLAIVIQKDQRTGPVFNLLCRIRNAGSTPVTIQSLEIHVTDPGSSSFGLRWNVLYEGREVQREMADTRALELSPNSYRSVGIQFVGPPSIVDYRWAEGVYNCEIRGHLADGRGDDILARFEMRLTAESAKDLTCWTKAGSVQWKALGDPDNAVGIPVVIS